MSISGVKKVLMITTMKGRGAKGDPIRAEWTFVDPDTCTVIATVDTWEIGELREKVLGRNSFADKD